MGPQVAGGHNKQESHSSYILFPQTHSVLSNERWSGGVIAGYKKQGHHRSAERHPIIPSQCVRLPVDAQRKGVHVVGAGDVGDCLTGEVTIK